MNTTAKMVEENGRVRRHVEGVGKQDQGVYEQLERNVKENFLVILQQKDVELLKADEELSRGEHELNETKEKLKKSEEKLVIEKNISDRNSLEVLKNFTKREIELSLELNEGNQKLVEKEEELKENTVKHEKLESENEIDFKLRDEMFNHVANEEEELRQKTVKLLAEKEELKQKYEKCEKLMAESWKQNTVKHEKLVAKKQEELKQKTAKHEQELQKIYQKLTEKEEELKQDTLKHAKLVGVLEERMECPVCLDIPTTGPVYTCSNGHCVCAACYRGPRSNCPSCRVRMFRNTSLLAATILQNIEHSCRNQGCLQKVAKEEKEEHKKACLFRLVTCPAFSCKEKVAFCHLVDHILNQCGSSMAKIKSTIIDVKGPAYCNYILNNCYLEDVLESFNVITLCWEGKYFFLTALKPPGSLWNFYVQMLGSLEECMRYRVSITIEEKVRGLVQTVCSAPFPINMEARVKREAGLVVRSTSMEGMLRQHASGRDFFTIKLDFAVI